MKCPYCGQLDSRVVDSRISKDNTITRRRRACSSCQRRFTTYERIELMLPMLIKKDGRREPWDRGKIVAGLEKACEKLAVSMADIDAFVDAIEQKLQDYGGKEIATSQVGDFPALGLDVGRIGIFPVQQFAESATDFIGF